MVSAIENLVYNKRLSSVVPAKMTEENMVKELTWKDLVMKLHYIRGVYFFRKSAVQDLKNTTFKEPMFGLLGVCNDISGRIRRISETGRPFIKCNDSGVRIIEGQSDKTVDEWLEMKALHNLLVFNQVLGPELGYSPLVFIQFTWLKCGGLSVGISWAHVLGDSFAATNFMNIWGQWVSGNYSTKSLELPKSDTQTMKAQMKKSSSFEEEEEEPVSVRKVEPVGDHWVVANNYKMETYCFQITASQLDHLKSKIPSIPTFEALSAMIWKCIAKVRQDGEPRTVTFCRNDSYNKEGKTVSNNQILSVVKADFSIVEAELSELATLVVEKSKEENSLIEEKMNKDDGLSDYSVYGANLTFVDLEGLELYGLEMNGQKPVFANYTVHEVSNEGVVLVLPGPEENVDGNNRRGRTINVTLQENQGRKLKEELEKEWSIV